MGRIATMISSQDDIHHILQRYNAVQAHNLAYNYEELRSLGIQPEFLMALLEVFENPKSFNPSEFSRFSLETIVDYLHKTHVFYLSKKLPEIEQSIHLLLRAYPEGHPLLLLLNTFYHEYRDHLGSHIDVEENKLMPYILQLEKKASGQEANLQGFPITVQEFIDQHHDTEKDLAEVRNTILHYSPPQENKTLYRILLSQLQVLEKDLAIHAMIEDDVLLPRALEFESQCNQQ